MRPAERAFVSTTPANQALVGDSVQLGRSRVPVVSLVILDPAGGHPSDLQTIIPNEPLSAAVRLHDGRTFGIRTRMVPCRNSMIVFNTVLPIHLLLARALTEGPAAGTCPALHD